MAAGGQAALDPQRPMPPERCGILVEIDDPELVEDSLVRTRDDHDFGAQAVNTVLLGDDPYLTAVEFDQGAGRKHADRPRKLLHDLGLEFDIRKDTQLTQRIVRR